MAFELRMPCYSPLRAVLRDGGPGGRRVLSFKADVRGKAISLPCGRCIGCRLERARQWAVRIVHEAKMHDENSFITLTYDDEHLPKYGSLSVKDCQAFMKALRRSIEPVRIRFFLCGEYGEERGRPHYHAIIFGFGFPDKVRVGGTRELPEFESKLLSSAWSRGGARIGSVTFDSASYVANYATKKITGPKAKEHYGKRKSEFLLMSRRPGIGRGWFDLFCSDVYPSDEVIVRGFATRPPRFYDSLFEKLDSAAMARIKVEREAKAAALEQYLLPTGEVVEVAAGNNLRRLVVREKVARAKFELKKRRIE